MRSRDEPPFLGSLLSRNIIRKTSPPKTWSTVCVFPSGRSYQAKYGTAIMGSLATEDRSAVSYSTPGALTPRALGSGQNRSNYISGMSLGISSILSITFLRAASPPSISTAPKIASIRVATSLSLVAHGELGFLCNSSARPVLFPIRPKLSLVNNVRYRESHSPARDVSDV